jgi:hypothetical protein
VSEDDDYHYLEQIERLEMDWDDKCIAIKADYDEMIAKLEESTRKFLDFTAQLKDQRKILPAEIDDFEDAANSALAELESWKAQNNG